MGNRFFPSLPHIIPQETHKTHSEKNNAEENDKLFLIQKETDMPNQIKFVHSHIQQWMKKNKKG